MDASECSEGPGDESSPTYVAHILGGEVGCKRIGEAEAVDLNQIAEDLAELDP